MSTSSPAASTNPFDTSAFNPLAADVPPAPSFVFGMRSVPNPDASSHSQIPRISSAASSASPSAVSASVSVIAAPSSTLSMPMSAFPSLMTYAADDMDLDDDELSPPQDRRVSGGDSSSSARAEQNGSSSSSSSSDLSGSRQKSRRVSFHAEEDDDEKDESVSAAVTSAVNAAQGGFGGFSGLSSCASAPKPATGGASSAAFARPHDRKVDDAAASSPPASSKSPEPAKTCSSISAGAPISGSVASSPSLSASSISSSASVIASASPVLSAPAASSSSSSKPAASISSVSVASLASASSSSSSSVPRFWDSSSIPAPKAAPVASSSPLPIAAVQDTHRDTMIATSSQLSCMSLAVEEDDEKGESVPQDSVGSIQPVRIPASATSDQLLADALALLDASSLPDDQLTVNDVMSQGKLVVQLKSIVSAGFRIMTPVALRTLADAVYTRLEAIRMHPEPLSCDLNGGNPSVSAVCFVLNAMSSTLTQVAGIWEDMQKDLLQTAAINAACNIKIQQTVSVA